MFAYYMICLSITKKYNGYQVVNKIGVEDANCG